MQTAVPPRRRGCPRPARRARRGLQRRPHRVRQRDVRDAAGAEERAGAVHGTVDELIHQHERARAQLLGNEPQAENDTRSVTPALERIDVGAEVDLARRDPVTAAVARQEHDLGAADAAEAQRVRGFTPGRGHAPAPEALEPGQS